jgi:hypothetical protein
MPEADTERRRIELKTCSKILNDYRKLRRIVVARRKLPGEARTGVNDWFLRLEAGTKVLEKGRWPLRMTRATELVESIGKDL